MTKGSGCIDATALCNEYIGTQVDCSKFKGDNGTKQCWNSSAST